MSTQVYVTELKQVLEENRAKHKKEYKKARKIWMKKAVKQLRRVADRAEKEQKLNGASFQPLTRLPKPISYLNSYDLMLAKLEAETRDVITLDDREFRAYWLDDWDWKGQFVGTTSLYTG